MCDATPNYRYKTLRIIGNNILTVCMPCRVNGNYELRDVHPLETAGNGSDYIHRKSDHYNGIVYRSARFVHVSPSKELSSACPASSSVVTSIVSETLQSSQGKIIWICKVTATIDGAFLRSFYAPWTLCSPLLSLI